jgi:hypothetical protein
MINLISSFYLSKYNSLLDDERTDELIQALINNLNSYIIEKIHLFIDDNDSYEKLNEIKYNNINSHKIVSINIKHQPTYHDFFNYILDNLPNHICMISNSDIYLHSYNINLLKLLDYNKYVYSLTRYEYDMTHPWIDIYNGSHDCYIFNSKYLDNRIICENTNFKQNLLGIETRIIKSFYDLNYIIFNPCKQIKIVHLHKTNLRNYTIEDDVAIHKNDYELWRNSVWYTAPCILELNKKEGIIYCINNNNYIKTILEDKKYNWGDTRIKFLKNNKMEAFGDGNYEIIDDFNIIANFGGREHNIKFNNDYTEFTSIRKDDLCIVNGKLLYDIEFL